MNEIILQNNNINADAENKIISIEKEISRLKTVQDELKKSLLAEMEAKGLIKVETPNLVISYIAPSDRETFDSKKLREDNPDLYDEYIKISPVKSSIRIKVK